MKIKKIKRIRNEPEPKEAIEDSRVAMMDQELGAEEEVDMIKTILMVIIQTGEEALITLEATEAHRELQDKTVIRIK